MTSGRRWSNHARLTAAAGAKAGLAVHLVLSGPPVDPPNPGVRLDELLGATVHQAATDDRAERTAIVDRVLAELRGAGRRPYLVAIGGTGIVGAIGQVLAGLELAEQARRPASGRTPSSSHPRPVAPRPGSWSGSGRRAWRRPSTASPSRRRTRCARTSRPSSPGSAGSTGLAEVGDADVVLDGSQLGAGYGRPTEAAAEATRLLARTEGILVDPIYTAKALAGLVALARDGALDGRRVVFWHAGGSPGLFEPLDA